MPESPTLAEQIEACEWAAARVEFPTTRKHLEAAARTLRRVQECRQLAQEQIAAGVRVAAELEGLIP